MCNIIKLQLYILMAGVEQFSIVGSRHGAVPFRAETKEWKNINTNYSDIYSI